MEARESIDDKNKHLFLTLPRLVSAQQEEIDGVVVEASVVRP